MYTLKSKLTIRHSFTMTNLLYVRWIKTETCWCASFMLPSWFLAVVVERIDFIETRRCSNIYKIVGTIEKRVVCWIVKSPALISLKLWRRWMSIYRNLLKHLNSQDKWNQPKFYANVSLSQHYKHLNTSNNVTTHCKRFS